MFFQPVINYICNVEASFLFALAIQTIGTPSDADELTGTVFIFKSREDWKGKAERRVRSNIYGLNDELFSLNVDRDANIERIFSDSVQVLGTTADISVDFHLFRTGEIYFARPVFQDSGPR